MVTSFVGADMDCSEGKDSRLLHQTVRIDTHRQDGAGGLAYDLLRRAPQEEMIDHSPTVRRDDDEINGFLLGVIQYFEVRIPVQNGRSTFDPRGHMLFLPLGEFLAPCS